MTTTATYRPATEKMFAFAWRLMDERRSTFQSLKSFDEFMADMAAGVRDQHIHCSYATISKMIDAVKEIERDAQPQRTAPAMPDVPEGYYALVNSNDRKVYFFRVDRPTEGRWAGRVFVNGLSGDNHVRYSYTEQMQILRGIARDVLEASTRYGIEAKRCGCCHKRLTTEESRTLGIGPKCLKEHFGDAGSDRAWKLAAARQEAAQERAAYEAEMRAEAAAGF